MILSKEPGTTSPTPWHYDEAYWPVFGTQICNLWTALDSIPKETALRFIRSSHRLKTDYRAVGFGPQIEYSGQNDPIPPDWDSDPGDHDIVYASLSRATVSLSTFVPITVRQVTRSTVAVDGLWRPIGWGMMRATTTSHGNETQTSVARI